MSWQVSPTKFYRNLEKLVRDSQVRDEGALNIPNGFHFVTAFDSGHVLTLRFFEALKCLGKRTSSNAILVATIEPDPWDYYFRHFKLIPAFEISDGVSAQQFLDELHWGPEKGGADSIACHADKLAIMANTEAWVIFADRVDEVARLFASDVNAVQTLKDCIPVEWRDWEGYQQ